MFKHPADAERFKEVVLDVGLALHGGNPYPIIQKAKQEAKAGSIARRTYEKMYKASKEDLYRATNLVLKWKGAE